MSKELALFCLLYPKTAEKRKRVLSLLEDNVSYYRSEKAKCTTWSYFTPSTRRGSASFIADAENPNGKETLVAGMEIYTDKSGLSIQMDEPWFQNFQKTARAEELFAKKDDLVVWYPTAGFVSRDDTAPPFGKGVVVVTGIVTCKDGMREKAVQTWGAYAEWVKRNEPATLSYSIMTRKKAPNDMLVFERFRNHEEFIAHTERKELKDSLCVFILQSQVKHAKRLSFADYDVNFSTEVRQFLERRPVYANEWDEVDTAFVGNVDGAGNKANSAADAKL